MRDSRSPELEDVAEREGGVYADGGCGDGGGDGGGCGRGTTCAGKAGGGSTCDAERCPELDVVD